MPSAELIQMVRRIDVPRRVGLCGAAVLLLALPGAGGVQAFQTVERVTFSMAPDRTGYEPGAEVRIAALLEIDEGWHVNSHRPSYDYLIPTRLELFPPEGWGEAEIAYPEPIHATFTFAEEPLSVFEGETVIEGRLEIPSGAEEGMAPVRGELTYQACNDTQCLPPVTTSAAVDLPVGDAGRATDPELFEGTAAPGSSSKEGLVGFLLLGFLGGLILNAMPCVLPVLSLKVFAIVQSAGLGRREIVKNGLSTSAGILFSFWGLAALAIGARAAGRAVGWGVQFQEPAFVAFLAVIVLLFTLNMWGLFEITLPGTVAQAAGKGSSEEGIGGHFVSGLFATLMATPCSAPFLGPAIGFAMTQSPVRILAIFTALGIGMATPYLVLAAWPRATRFLPKPGAWMARLKEIMGFLLAGAAVWLFYVLAAQMTPVRLAVLELTLLALAFAVWLRSISSAKALGRLAMVGVVAAAAGTLWVAAAAPPPRSQDLAESQNPGGWVDWVPFDEDRALELAAGGTPVFVDVTADWCFTCKVNERLVLDTPEIAQAFEERGVVAMRADWTNRSEAIGRYLADHGRYGIPFYLLYRPGKEPHLFGELITQEGILRVLQTLESR
ncbi:MAG: thioredoxin family protein [Thermoanaerobaculia bacterium]|nr:thioredoxin family protein [Thermoanaerobaculia bacterium]